MQFSSQQAQEARLKDTNLRIYIPEIRGLDVVMRELNDLEPGLVREFKKDLVTEIKPLYQIVKRKVEQSKPFLSGFDHDGRTGLRRNPVRVTGKAVTARRGRRTSLVSIRTVSAAAQIADMAGRKATGNTPQGKSMIATLTDRFGTASRFIYPAIEREIPRVQQAMIKIMEKYADKVNRRLVVQAKDNL